MKQQLISGLMIAFVVLVSLPAHGHVVDPIPRNGDKGFEIGNGRKNIRNLAGKYGINVPERWEAGLFEKFTEVIAPLYEGTPRSRLQINVISTNGVRSPIDLIKSKTDEDNWSRVTLNDLEGVKRQTKGHAGMHEIDIELLRNERDLVVIHIEGKPKKGMRSSMDDLYDSLKTIRIQ